MSKYKLPKVLIAVPTYEAKNYCLSQFMDNVRNFTYPKKLIEIYVADNSKTNHNSFERQNIELLELRRKMGVTSS